MFTDDTDFEIMHCKIYYKTNWHSNNPMSFICIAWNMESFDFDGKICNFILHLKMLSIHVFNLYILSKK